MGGVCIYIRSNINYQVRDDLHSATLENLVVEIKNRDLVCFSQYLV